MRRRKAEKGLCDDRTFHSGSKKKKAAEMTVLMSYFIGTALIQLFEQSIMLIQLTHNNGGDN
jgi:hypothetical protein